MQHILLLIFRDMSEQVGENGAYDQGVAKMELECFHHSSLVVEA